MLDVFIKVDIHELEHLSEIVRVAQSRAVRIVARNLVLPAMRQALSFRGEHAPTGQLGTRTGELLGRLKVKVFRDKTGLTNESVKVIGARAHIARFHESGTKSHGPGNKGGPLPARKMFETVGSGLRASIEQQLIIEFEQIMKALGDSRSVSELLTSAKETAGSFAL